MFQKHLLIFLSSLSKIFGTLLFYEYPLSSFDLLLKFYFNFEFDSGLASKSSIHLICLSTNYFHFVI